MVWLLELKAAERLADSHCNLKLAQEEFCHNQEQTAAALYSVHKTKICVSKLLYFVLIFTVPKIIILPYFYVTQYNK